jgi:hypothetical protein
MRCHDDSIVSTYLHNRPPLFWPYNIFKSKKIVFISLNTVNSTNSNSQLFLTYIFIYKLKNCTASYEQTTTNHASSAQSCPLSGPKKTNFLVICPFYASLYRNHSSFLLPSASNAFCSIFNLTFCRGLGN